MPVGETHRDRRLLFGGAGEGQTAPGRSGLTMSVVSIRGRRNRIPFIGMLWTAGNEAAVLPRPDLARRNRMAGGSIQNQRRLWFPSLRQPAALGFQTPKMILKKSGVTVCATSL